MNRSRAVVLTTVTAAAALVIALVAGGAVAEKVIPGLGDAGTLTRWGLPIAQMAMNLGAGLTVGALLMAAALLPSVKGRLSVDAIRYVRAGSWLAAGWATAAAATLVLTVADILGEPVSQVLAGNELSSYVGQLPQGTALMLVILLTVVIALLGRTTVTAGATLGLLAAAVIAVLPPPLTGHSASSPNHSLAVTGVALHIGAVVPWVGGLAILAWHALGKGDRLGLAAARFSRMALYCYVVVGISGVVNAVTRLPDPAGLFTSAYGQLILVKAIAFAVLGWFGWLHRTRTLPAVAEGRPYAFARLAAVETAVLAGTMGVAVALARTAPPAVSAGVDPVKDLLGYDLPPAITAVRLATMWRLDLFFATVVIVLGGAYIGGLVRLRRRGDAWPVGRTAAWFTGLLTIVLATMSGIGTYAPVLFSTHMIQHMTLAMLSPIFLVLGGPITLALRALKPAAVKDDRGPREWLTIVLHSRFTKVIGHPAVATVIFVGSTYVLYFSPLFESLMRGHLGHIAMISHFLLSGSLFYWVLIGIDPAPHKPPYAARILILFVTMPFHAFFGIALMNTNSLANNWYTSLGRTWGTSIAQDIHTGGSIAWAFGEIPTLIVLIALVFQWFVDEQRTAIRLDRKADRATANQENSDLDDYNDYLASLDRRGGRADLPRPGET
ncbi:MAG TPA: cytochrome c oxidase assembly protein [Streptosporangiaceae bacterium]|nr:cytochrome c oxidase assembly protein [Streptosporangiaceae bacterium]